MLNSSFNISSVGDTTGWGDKGHEIIAAPMRDVLVDRDLITNILSPETRLVSLSEQEPSNEDSVAELSKLVPFFPNKRNRQVITFYGIGRFITHEK